MRGLCLILVVLAAAPLLAGCAGGGGGSKQVAEPVVGSFDDWMRSWRGQVRPGLRPNHVTIPVPPSLEIPSVADDLGRTVDDAADTFSDEVAEFGYAETRRVFCQWYGWYLETGQTVPSESDFPALLLRYGFGRVFTTPPSLRLRGGIESFRQAIERGQTEVEDVRNASIAAACA
jgi:hypothetical protein